MEVLNIHIFISFCYRKSQKHRNLPALVGVKSLLEGLLLLIHLLSHNGLSLAFSLRS